MPFVYVLGHLLGPNEDPVMRPTAGTFCMPRCRLGPLLGPPSGPKRGTSFWHICRPSVVPVSAKNWCGLAATKHRAITRFVTMEGCLIVDYV